ncbi:hypothetical protein SO802_031622 [Lithocarpus litseifolius]|uniref:Uncharacterized protein n=1 Tax=Lithocarpus litseifolius TaxID=425828 RepID=A0AAW2BKR8_9ROSI
MGFLSSICCCFYLPSRVSSDGGGGVLIEDEGLTEASEEDGEGDGGEFTTAGDEASTGVFLTVGDGAEALGVGVCVGDFDRECEGDWAKVDIEENPSFNTPSCLQVSDFTLKI